MPCGVQVFVAVVCGLRGVGGGEARIAGASVPGVCGFSGGGGGQCCGARGCPRWSSVWATGWGVGRKGQGVWGRVCMRCVGVCDCLQRCACVVRAGLQVSR